MLDPATVRAFADETVKIVGLTPAETVGTAFANIMRNTPAGDDASLATISNLVATGQLQGQLLEPLDLIPLGGPLGGNGEIDHLVVVPPPALEDGGYPARFALPSGQVDVLMLLGITQREADFLRSQGAEAMLALLRHREVLPLTDVGSPSAL